MEDKKKNNEIIEIDLKRVWHAIWHRAWLICIVSVLSAVIVLLGTIYLITPQYQSSAMFYVNNTALSVGDAALSITSGDLSAAQSLVESYVVILKTRSSLNEVIDYADIKRPYSELRDMISAGAVNETEIFEVVVTSPDPVEAEQIANAIAYILPKRIANIIEGSSAKIVDYAVVPSSPSSPSYTNNTVVGFLVGFLLSVGIIALLEIFDVTIRTEEDIEQSCAHPVLAAVPDMAAASKGGSYYYGYGKRKKKYGGYYSYADSSRKRRKDAAAQDELNLIGKDISFAASEAYKLLRTKLQFSFVDDVKCPVIGVSSAMAGEGKSLSSVNLAYSLAQLEKKVLLIDCDLRRPSISTKLPIQKVPGLSNYLTGQIGMDMIIQGCKVDTEEGFDVISSGRNPPNPIELLSSVTMNRAIDELRDKYDYIILDLPPVGEVSDAMVAAKLVDGVLLVVRQDYCNTVALSNAVHQFEFIDAKILGLVMNCVGDGSGRYGRYYRYGKRYYKRYYSRYYSRYRHSSYEAAAKSKKNPSDENGRT